MTTDDDEVTDVYQPPMSLREWYAAHALPECIRELWGEPDAAEQVAIAAFEIADAMVSKGGGKS